MPEHDLTVTLQALVRRHGMRSVLHSLADVQAVPEKSTPSLSSKRNRSPGSRISAVEYVGRMTLPPGKSDAMERAAQRFEDRAFLPGIGDIREFCRIHGIELSKSVSRASAIPRVFTYLAAMDTDRITKVLDEGAFSGPVRLAPIADAIRNRPVGRRRTDTAETAPPISATTTSNKPKFP